MDDLSALQGRWKVVELTLGGAKMPASMFPAAEIVVAGDAFTTSGMGAAYGGMLTLAEAGGRKTFTLAFKDAGPERGAANHGLYDLNDDDWRICLDLKGGPAPADFVSTAADGYALERLKRIR